MEMVEKGPLFSILSIVGLFVAIRFLFEANGITRFSGLNFFLS
jgi:hypothetical protein